MAVQNHFRTYTSIIIMYYIFYEIYVFYGINRRVYVSNWNTSCWIRVKIVSFFFISNMFIRNVRQQCIGTSNIRQILYSVHQSTKNTCKQTHAGYVYPRIWFVSSVILTTTLPISISFVVGNIENTHAAFFWNFPYFANDAVENRLKITCPPSFGVLCSSLIKWSDRSVYMPPPVKSGEIDLFPLRIGKPAHRIRKK